MLFEEEVPEDKGLFTFYREQAQREQELIRNKKLKKELKMMQLKPIPQLPPIHLPQKISPVKTNTVRKVNSLKEKITKAKPPLAKQRLLESVVDMSQHIEQQKDNYIDKQELLLRFKQPKLMQKSMRYKQKINELNLSMEHDSTFFQDESITNQLHVESLHRRNQSEELTTSRTKPAIHTTRGSLQLPEIRKLEQQKPYLKVRKSIKSQFIQQALRMKDLDKIKSMRYYLKGRSSAQFQQEQEAQRVQNFNPDSKSFQAFKFHQQRLLSILKKFKRKL